MHTFAQPGKSSATAQKISAPQHGLRSQQHQQQITAFLQNQRDNAAEAKSAAEELEEQVETSDLTTAAQTTASDSTSNGSGGIQSNPTGKQQITTILRPGQSPHTFEGGIPAPDSEVETAHANVAPGGAANVNNSAANNTCTPDVAGSTLSWSVASADANNWTVNVNSFTLTGQININPWASQPNSMVVPNTANPVDGGNINNTAGSDNHWQAAIDDMADYDTAGGGAGPNWHAEAASRAHENAHWTGDYVGDAVTSASGGNWSQTNTDLDALREAKSSSADAAAARTALTPRVNARLATWRRATVSRWNTLIRTTDSPGGGGRGYAAGAAVLSGLISSVRAYARSKGWTGSP